MRTWLGHSQWCLHQGNKTRRDQDVGKVPESSLGYTYAKPNRVHPGEGGLEFSPAKAATWKERASPAMQYSQEDLRQKPLG